MTDYRIIVAGSRHHIEPTRLWISLMLVALAGTATAHDELRDGCHTHDAAARIAGVRLELQEPASIYRGWLRGEPEQTSDLELMIDPMRALTEFRSSVVVCNCRRNVSQ